MLGATTARTGPSASISARVALSSATGECTKRLPSPRRTTVIRVPVSSPKKRARRGVDQTPSRNGVSIAGCYLVSRIAVGKAQPQPEDADSPPVGRRPPVPERRVALLHRVAKPDVGGAARECVALRGVARDAVEERSHDLGGGD